MKRTQKTKSEQGNNPKGTTKRSTFKNIETTSQGKRYRTRKKCTVENLYLYHHLSNFNLTGTVKLLRIIIFTFGISHKNMYDEERACL